MLEKTVEFVCGGHRVYGVLNIPDSGPFLKIGAGVLFLNAGIRGRVGPYRQYVRFARRLCEAGLYTLRFDPPGVGESAGYLADWGDYQRRVVEDVSITQNAIDFFMAETGIKHLGLMGLCGGAVNALLTAGEDRRVDFLVLLSIPVEDLGNLSEDAAVSRIGLRQYFIKLFQWSSWRNLFLLRSNFHIMLKALGELKDYRKLRIVCEPLWEAFDGHTKRGGKVLFVFGGNDPFHQMFIDSFGIRLSRMPRKRAYYESYLIEKANHLFSQASWHEMIIGKVLEWLPGGCRSI